MHAELNRDIRQHFIFDNLPIRGSFIRLSRVSERALKAHHYPEAISQLLLEALVSVVMLGGIGKQKGKMLLQFQGQEALKMLTAQCSFAGFVRGLAQFDAQALQHQSLITALQAGQLAVIYQPEHTVQQFQSLVPIVGESLADALGYYFIQSEQIATKIYFFKHEAEIVGLMLQALPESSLGAQKQAMEYVTALADTLATPEVLMHDNLTLLQRMFHQDDVRFFEAQPLTYGCEDRARRFENAILALGQAEAESLLAEKSVIEVTCEFCNQSFLFDRHDVAAIFRGERVNDDTSHFPCGA